MWIHHILIEVGTTHSTPAKIWCDNQVSLHISSNPLYHERKKYIEVDCQFVREKIQDKFISTIYVKTGEQLDDLFANALNGSRVDYFFDKLGMINNYALDWGGVV